MIARHPEPDDDGDGEERDGGRQPPAPRSVGHDRERDGPEPGELAPQRGVRSGDRRAGPGHQGGQPADQDGVGRGRPHHRQVGGNPLVELDELVDLGTGEAAALLDQLFEPVPGVLVRQHEGVDVHRAMLVGLVAWVRYDAGARDGGDGGRGGPRRPDRPAAGAGRRRPDRHLRRGGRLSGRRDAVGGHGDAVRRGAQRGDPDHLHGAGDRSAIRSCSRPRPAAGRWARW